MSLKDERWDCRFLMGLVLFCLFLGTLSVVAIARVPPDCCPDAGQWVDRYADTTEVDQWQREEVDAVSGEPFRVIGVAPPPNSHDSPLDTMLVITADGTISPTSVTSRTLSVQGSFQGHLDGSVDLVTPFSIVYDPYADLRPGELVQTTASSGIQDESGIPLVPYVWKFQAGTRGGSGRFLTGNDVGPGDDDTYWGLALGDVDGDGDLDLAVGNEGQNVVYLNDGDGSFDTTAYTFGSGDDATTSLALGDVDADGDLDLVAGNVGRNMVYLNDGDGSFDTTSYGVGPGTGTTFSLLLGDVDGDGDLDLVVGNWQQANSVYFNDGDGTFDTTVHDVGPGDDWTVDLDLGDVDGDGDLDVAVSNYGQCAVHLNDGDGTFDTTTYEVGDNNTASTGIALADLDGDGDLDLVVGRESYKNYVFINDGDGTYDTRSYIVGYIGGHTYGLDVGDLDGDGDVDIVFGNYVDWNFAILNNGDGTFDPPWLDFGSQIESTHGVALGDLDGDGDLDVAIGNLNRQNAVYLNADPVNLSISKEVYPAIAAPGDTIAYTLSYANYGPEVARDVVITDLVPPTLTNVVYSASGAWITPTGLGDYAWAVEDLDMGEGGLITISGQVDLSAGGCFSLTNYASISSAGYDTDVLNNAQAVSSTVDALAPQILGTMPGNGELDVALGAPLVITFSEAIVTGTFDYEFEPDPGGWVAAWSNGDRVVTLDHAPFAHGTVYSVTVNAADDVVGNLLWDAPVDWVFATTSAAHYELYLPIAVGND